MQDKLAKAISAITSPYIVIAAFALWVIATYTDSWLQFAELGAAFIGFIVLLPLLWILWGVKAGKFTDIHVMVREQRFEPFVVATIGAALLVGTYLLLGAPHLLVTLAVNILINGFVFATLTRVWKVSIDRYGIF